MSLSHCLVKDDQEETVAPTKKEKKRKKKSQDEVANVDQEEQKVRARTTIDSLLT